MSALRPEPAVEVISLKRSAYDPKQTSDVSWQAERYAPLSHRNVHLDHNKN